jgi:hypothetical protein
MLWREPCVPVSHALQGKVCHSQGPLVRRSLVDKYNILFTIEKVNSILYDYNVYSEQLTGGRDAR